MYEVRFDLLCESASACGAVYDKWMRYSAKQNRTKAFYEHTGGGITVSGGEMLSHHGFVEELISEAGKKRYAGMP